MYEDFFDLTEKPFSIQPDPAFMFWGRNHRLAYAMLEYGVLNNAGISVITGGVGCGKTTLLHRLLDQLTDTHTIALLSNIQPDRGNLLSWVLMGFNQPFTNKAHVEQFQQLQAFFIAEYSKGKRCVLIIDEAQNLSPDMLEEIRMLSNINAGRDQLLQLILVGQPQLKSILNHPDMLQLTQRIGSDFHLTPLTPDEVHAYIDTRLRVAGASRPIFSDEAKALVAKHSRGVPRVINVLADTALVYAFSSQEEVVSEQIVARVIEDKQSFGVFGMPRIEDSGGTPAPDYEKHHQLRGSKGHPETFTDASEGGFVSLARQPEVTTPAVETRPKAQQAPAKLVAPSAQAAAQAAVDISLQENFNDEQIIGPSVVSALSNGHAKAEAQAQARAQAQAQADRALRAKAPVDQVDAAWTMPAVGFVVLEKPDGPLPENAIDAIGLDYPIVFVTYSGDPAHGDAARAAGAVVVKMRGENETPPARSRNAGFRQLRKIAPDLEFVHFLDANAILQDGWLEAAVKFLMRRPEVAAIEGNVNDGATNSWSGNKISHHEIRTSGDNVLIRVQNFVELGGFRGDLVVADVQDFCLRTRGRGHHVWHLSTPMAASVQKKKTLSGWWKQARSIGFEYAFSAALHGAPPERFRVVDMQQAILWGFAFPMIIIALALSFTALTYYALPVGIPVLWGAIVVLIGTLIYIIKALIEARKPIAGQQSGFLTRFPKRLKATIAHFPEFLGVVGFYRWRRKQLTKTSTEDVD